jgi:hypothetical protein
MVSTDMIASAGQNDELAEAHQPNATNQPNQLASGDENASALLPSDDIESMTERWQAIQTGFVDTPRESVQHADELVAELMQRLAKMFADERSRLESQLSRDDSLSTEDLRVALQRYRSFFQRLLVV